MAHQVKVSATEPAPLSLAPGTHVVEGVNGLLKFVCCLHRGSCVQPLLQNITKNKSNNKKFKN